MRHTSSIYPLPRILVVDDEPINREIIRVLLQAEGYRVFEASDGAEALRLLQHPGADLVLLDVMMPGLDGFETCRRIREEVAFLTLPVIFLTSLDDRDSRVRCKALGADDFLSKPVDSVELCARVHNLLRVKAYHDLRARQQECLEEELARTREQLLRTDRLATLGTLAGGVGHELNNVLNVLTVTLGMVQERARAGLPPSEKDLERLGSVSQHMATHARQLLNYARPGPTYAERLNLQRIVTETLDMLRLAGRLKGFDVETCFPPQPVVVQVNRARIEQILVNLACNAADAVAEARPPRYWLRVSLAEPSGGRVTCCVEDNGTGIAPDKLNAIFEPYYTTKPPEKGTGLGLAVVKAIVESYGGHVLVTSAAGKGSAFSFDLPVAEAAAPAQPPAPAA